MRKKSLILVAFFILGIITSCQEENKPLRSNTELTQLLKDDAEFQDYFEEATQAQLILSEKLMQINSKEKLSRIIKSNNLNEICNQLNLSDNIMKNMNEKLSDIINELPIRYPELNSKTEDELSTIVQGAVMINESYGIILGNLKQTMEDVRCQEQFEADFHRIHAAYDSGVIYCLIAAFATGGVAYVPCNAVNIYSTLVDLANALDAYAMCASSN